MEPGGTDGPSPPAGEAGQGCAAERGVGPGRGGTGCRTRLRLHMSCAGSGSCPTFECNTQLWSWTQVSLAESVNIGRCPLSGGQAA